MSETLSRAALTYYHDDQALNASESRQRRYHIRKRMEKQRGIIKDYEISNLPQSERLQFVPAVLSYAFDRIPRELLHLMSDREINASLDRNWKIMQPDPWLEIHDMEHNSKVPDGWAALLIFLFREKREIEKQIELEGFLINA